MITPWFLSTHQLGLNCQRNPGSNVVVSKHFDRSRRLSLKPIKSQLLNVSELCNAFLSNYCFSQNWIDWELWNLSLFIFHDKSKFVKFRKSSYIQYISLWRIYQLMFQVNGRISRTYNCNSGFTNQCCLQYMFKVASVNG